MSFLTLLDEFSKDNLDDEATDVLLSRKKALGKISNFSKKLPLAALPLGAIGAFSSPAKAQSTDDIVSVLNFALTLEFLEYRFYEKGCGCKVIPKKKRAVFNQIEKHELAHTIFLQETINSLGGTPIEEPEFDFTAGGAFDPFNKFADFLALSQAFEDTGVRAYKGQAGNLQGSAAALTAALRIHSVEARHASQVRRIRTRLGLDDIKGWITRDNRGTLPEATQPTYNGEANTTHVDLDVTTITEIDLDGVTEGWDEPLARAEVEAIASLFIVS